MYYHNFPRLVASLFSWRCLAASPSYFLHAAINLRPPSVTVSTHTSASNAITFQRPDVTLYAIDPLYLLPIPSFPHCTLKARQGKVSEHNSLWQPPAAHSDERSARKSILVHNTVSMLSYRVISRARLYEVIRWSGLLPCASMMMRSNARWCTVRSLA